MKTINIRAARLFVLSSLLMAGGLLLPVVASATPISFYNDASVPSATPRFTVGCGSASGDCSGLLEALSSDSPLAWSSSIGQMFVGPSKASETAELSFVNVLLGTGFTSSDSSLNTQPSSNEFQLDANYLLIKVGGGPTHQAYALLHNLDGNLDLWFTATGQAGGLSHYITFGPTSVPVPEPAALGVFGLGALLAGLFVSLRRRFT